MAQRATRVASVAPSSMFGVNNYAVSQRRAFGALTGDGAAWADEQYQLWLADPSNVHPSWDLYFKGGMTGQGSYPAGGLPGIAPGSASPAGAGGVSGANDDVSRLWHLIDSYQRFGHQAANLDPLGIKGRNKELDALKITQHGFTEADLNRPMDLSFGFNVESMRRLCLLADADGDHDGKTTLSEIQSCLQRAYCGTTGVEYMHISTLEKRQFIRDVIELPPVQRSDTELHLLLDRLAYADRFEAFLKTKYGAAKRFGVEGLESFIPGLKELIDVSSAHGVESIVIGMPHRGRLNVLANVIRKPMEIIFKEFAGTNVPEQNDDDDWSGSGDVKYHLGTQYSRRYPDGREVEIALLANPSHLEAVNAVVHGKARAKMQSLGDDTGTKVLPIVLHGDAAFAGQGIVYETLQFSRLDNYSNGGTIHVICNNQIGFTTTPEEDRSTLYASDLGKAFDIPVFHVNGDDPIEVVRIFKLAADYRARFHEDVVIDVIGYRRHGHNELDQPLFTQPMMYHAIHQHPTTLDLFKQQLVRDGKMSQADVDGVVSKCETTINAMFERSAEYNIPKEAWSPTLNIKNFEREPAAAANGVVTGVSSKELAVVAQDLTSIPETITVNNIIKKIYAAKHKALAAQDHIDWGTAEALAFGSLLRQGVEVRLSGQDAQRGTFSHRHAVIHDQKSDDTWTPLANVTDATASFSVSNSSLSEYGVLGFEFGYSIEAMNALTIWEAQFGDFVNGAQIMIDQFISTGEAKWFRQTGLVMLLPHGYEGQGPEHSSCRIERFLQNSDEDPDVVPQGDSESAIRATNWQIVNCSTPANYFHVLRRQICRDFRKPLVVATPKSLLRHKLCVSTFDDMAEGTTFQTTIGEQEELCADEQVRRVILCSGKIYYELLQARQLAEINDIAIVRVEQISPFPFREVAATMSKYSEAECVWVQEEPKNMGAWYFVQDRIMTATRVVNNKEIRPAYIGRGTMAAPAEGYGSVHTREQNEICRLAMSDSVSSYGHGRLTRDL